MFHQVLANLVDLDVNKLYVAQDIFYIHTIELDAYIRIFKTNLIEIFSFSKTKILIINFFEKNELLFESK